MRTLLLQEDVEDAECEFMTKFIIEFIVKLCQMEQIMWNDSHI